SAPPPPHIVIGFGLSAFPAAAGQAGAASLRFLTLFFLALAFSEAGTISITSTDPPAFSIASRAPFDTPATLNDSLAVSSPLPSRRTPFLPPRATPAAFSAA